MLRKLLVLLITPRKVNCGKYKKNISYIQELMLDGIIRDNLDNLSLVIDMNFLLTIFSILKDDVVKNVAYYDFIRPEVQENPFELSFYSDKDPHRILLATFAELLIRTNLDINAIVVELWKTKAKKGSPLNILKRLGYWVLNKKFAELRGDFFCTISDLSNEDSYIFYQFSEFVKKFHFSFTHSEVKILTKMIWTYRKGNYKEFREEQIFRLITLFPNYKSTRKSKLVNKFTSSPYNLEIDSVDTDFRPSKSFIGPADVPPQSAQNFQELTVEHIVGYIKNYAEKNSIGGISSLGVERAFFDDAHKNPMKYLVKAQFLANNLKRPYKRKLFDAFEYSGIVKDDSRKTLVLEAIEAFLPHLDCNDEVIFEFGDIFKMFFHQNGNSATVNELDRWKQIFTCICKGVVPDNSYSRERQDYFEPYTVYGYAWKAIIQLQILYWNKQTDAKKMNKKWDKDIEIILNDELQSPSLELIGLFGQCAYQIRYNSGKWFNSKVNKFLPKNDDESWFFFMKSFLLMAKHVNNSQEDFKGFFNILKKRGDLIKASNHDILGVHIGLINYLLLDFTKTFDTPEFDNYAMNLIFNETQKVKVYQNLVSHFSHGITIRETIPKYDSHCRYLWRRLFSIIETKIAEKEFQRLASHLLYWTHYLSKIDGEAYKWLSFSLTNSDFYRSNDFIKSIIPHARKHKNSRKNIGNLLVVMSKNPKLKDVPVKELEELFDILINEVHIDVIKEILDNLGNNGHFNLRPLHDKYITRI